MSSYAYEYANDASVQTVIDTIGAAPAAEGPDVQRQILAAVCQTGGSGAASGLTDTQLRASSVAVKVPGAANVAVAQVTAGAAADTLAVARPTRTGCLIRNTDASLSVYIGPATVTAANGMLLKAGESVPVTWVGLIQVIAPSGAPVVAVWDEYN